MSMTNSNKIKPRVIDGLLMQGMLSTEDFGGAEFIEGTYRDPSATQWSRARDDWINALRGEYTVKARDSWLFDVTHADGCVNLCRLYYSSSGEDDHHFFADDHGCLHLPIGWRSGTLRNAWKKARARARWALVRHNLARKE